MIGHYAPALNRDERVFLIDVADSAVDNLSGTVTADSRGPFPRIDLTDNVREILKPGSFLQNDMVYAAGTIIMVLATATGIRARPTHRKDFK